MKNSNKILVSNDKFVAPVKKDDETPSTSPAPKLRRVVDMSSISSSTYSTTTKKTDHEHANHGAKKDSNSGAPTHEQHVHRATNRHAASTTDSAQHKHISAPDNVKSSQKSSETNASVSHKNAVATTRENVNATAEAAPRPMHKVAPTEPSVTPVSHNEITAPQTSLVAHDNLETPENHTAGIHRHARITKPVIAHGKKQAMHAHKPDHAAQPQAPSNDGAPKPFVPQFAKAGTKGGFGDYLYRERLQRHNYGVEASGSQTRIGHTTTRQSNIFPTVKRTRQSLVQSTRPTKLEDVIAHLTASLHNKHAQNWISSFAMLAPQFSQMMCDGEILKPLVENEHIAPGEYAAHVDSKKGSARVTIQLHVHTSGQWDTVVSKLTAQASYSAALLNGQLPDNCEEVFKQGSVALYPQKPREVEMYCDLCRTNACEHIGGAILKFADNIELDPFCLLMLRGIERDDLINRLRISRSDHDVGNQMPKPRNFEMPALQAELFRKFYELKAPIDQIEADIRQETSTLLSRMGNPVEWRAPYSVAFCMKPVLELAAYNAAEVAAVLQYSQSETKETGLPTRPPAPFFRHYPDFNILYDLIDPNHIERMTRPLMEGLADLIHNLEPNKSTDARTLARQTRFRKSDVLYITDALVQIGFLVKTDEDEHAKFSIAPEYQVARQMGLTLGTPVRRYMQNTDSTTRPRVQAEKTPDSSPHPAAKPKPDPVPEEEPIFEKATIVGSVPIYKTASGFKPVPDAALSSPKPLRAPTQPALINNYSWSDHAPSAAPAPATNDTNAPSDNKTTEPDQNTTDTSAPIDDDPQD